MHAPIILHIIYITVDNNIVYQIFLVNKVVSSFHLYFKSLFQEKLFHLWHFRDVSKELK